MNVVSRLFVCVKGYRSKNEICGMGWKRLGYRKRRGNTEGGLETKMYRFCGLVDIWSEWIDIRQILKRTSIVYTNC